MNSRRAYIVAGICCATEESILRKQLDASIGTEQYDFTLATSRLCVDATIDPPKVFRHLREAGFDAKTVEEVVEDEPFFRRHRGAFELTGASLIAVSGVLVGYFGGSPILSHVFLAFAIILGGRGIFWKAWRALRTRNVDMNVLMSIAVVGAVAINRWDEAAAVVLLFALSLIIESYSVRRTRAAVETLIRRAPDEALVIRDGIEMRVPASLVSAGEIFRVRPGERVALDGYVEDGESTVDESALTGESRGVEKSAGDTVRAGSINGRGALRLRAACAYEDTAIARIVRLMESALHQKSAAQRAVDRFAARYTPAMLALATLVAVVPPLLFDASFALWLYRALVLLVIACPCAMVIATPVTVVSALTAAARRGVLIKGGETLEALASVRNVVFDKTGTVTEGRPRVTDVVTLNGYSRERALAIAASINRSSEHHLASAILAEAARHGVDGDESSARFQSHPGLGVTGTVGGKEFRMGSRRFVEEWRPLDARTIDTLAQFQRDGKTAVVLTSSDEHVALFAARDSVRPHAREQLDTLQKLGLDLMLLSGDEEAATRRVATALDIRIVAFGRMPDEKVSAIQDLEKHSGPVAMVGDGINDAPALAVATVGIAMGIAGTDATLASADVVLMSDDLSRLPGLVRLSRQAMRVVRQNLGLALSLKAIFIILGVFGLSGLWMAILADDGAALIVILNGLRLLKSSKFDR